MSTLSQLPATIDLDASDARLVLALSDHAASLYRHVTSSGEVAKYVSWRPHTSVGETRQLLEGFMDANERGNERNWSILSASGDAIGLVSCWLDKPFSVEVGFCLGQLWWGRSIMGRVIGYLNETLSKVPAIYRLWATCDPANARSAGLLSKSGFVQEGVLVRHAIRPNLCAAPRSSLVFGMALR